MAAARVGAEVTDSGPAIPVPDKKKLSRKGRPKSPSWLRDMRLVFSTAGREGVESGLSPTQLVLLKLFRENPDRFMTRLMGYEKERQEWLVRIEQAKRGEAAAEDAGAKKVRETIEELLRGM